MSETVARTAAGGWDSREALLARLTQQAWDVLVIGGGITGAAILREAARAGLKAALVEQRDFAWGTSSRSSKLVHGGLRYLKQAEFRLTAGAVRERVRLLQEAPGLVDPLGFLFATYSHDRVTRWLYALGLSIYDVMAGRWDHRRFDAEDFALLAPYVARQGLDGGYRYEDAQTDDARLVLRVLREAQNAGALALNYVSARGLLKGSRGVEGVVLKDAVSGREMDLRAGLVVNATGAWADRLRKDVGGQARIRPLRGSHLTFPAWRFPAGQAFMFPHQADKRPIFVIPWEGVTLVGTTDLDHDAPLDQEPRMSQREVDYLMDGLHRHFPALGLQPADALASFAGVRPVVSSGKKDPSKESRDHVVWEEEGLLTVTGGKLTTFRLIARDALRAAASRLPKRPIDDDQGRVLDEAQLGTVPDALSAEAARRLLGRHGTAAGAVLLGARAEDLETIPGTLTLWAEVRHAAQSEAVVHLEDLLLRRTRLGLLLAEGGAAVLGRVRALAQPELGWTDARWEEEERAYRALWGQSYAVTPAAVAVAAAS